jgi:hypothetical protein
MTKSKIFFVIGLLGLMSCDPVHDLHLENKTDGQIFVQTKKGGKQDTLVAGASIKIGQCVARYNPIVSDIESDYLKIVDKTDTITLKGRNAIFSMLQKVDKLDWRIIIRDK